MTTTILLQEWKTGLVPGAVLTAEDHMLVEHLNEGSDTRLEVEEWREGIHLATRSWVGLLHFSSFDLQIIPKLAGENLGLVELIDYQPVAKVLFST